MDDADNPETLSNVLEARHRLSALLLLSFCSLLFLSGCSFPRIVVLEDPLTAEEHLNLGVVYEQKGEFGSAAKEYKMAAKKLPVAYLYLGNAHLKKNEFDEAEQYYRRAMKKDARNADAYNNLAWLYYMQGKNLNDAESLALKALELNPSKSSIYKDTLEKIRGLKKRVR